MLRKLGMLLKAPACYIAAERVFLDVALPLLDSGEQFRQTSDLLLGTFDGLVERSTEHLMGTRSNMQWVECSMAHGIGHSM